MELIRHGLVVRASSDQDNALPPTPALSAGQRRALQSALRVFATKGYGGASIRDIAADAGFQSANLYNHFASKETMLAALAQIGLEELLGLETAALLECEPDPARQLAVMIRTAVTTTMAYPALVRVVSYELGHLSDEVQATASALYTQLFSLLEQVLRRGRDAGRFAFGDLDITLMALGSLNRDLARWFPQDHDHTSEQLADEYVRIALRIVGATEGGSENDQD